MESIRIIKEMHDESRRTNQPVRPRFLVFENVTGVLSSNDGEDFRTILEEVIHIVDPDSDVPRLAEGQSWSGVGCVLGDGWSLSWKIADRMVEQLKADGVEDPTMASLFDGIGGFPLAYQSAGCKPIWASEIEEFPIAVTKIHFPEEEERKN